MLDRVKRRSMMANQHFADCRRIEAHVHGDAEWTIGHNDERVLLALEDTQPVALTADDADKFAAALALRAEKVRLEACDDPAA